jgi:hypothetical protein
VSSRTDLFLGIIAFATLASAIVRVGVIVAAGLLVRRVNRMVGQFEQELKPLLAQVNAIARDASRAASLAVAQVERIDRMLADVSQKIEQTLATVQATIVTPAREGLALLSAFRAVMAALRERRGRGRERAGEEEDALFI